MTRIRRHGPTRRGFTLIELLVVIAIIAILVSLTAAAVMKVLAKIPEIQTRNDISELETALGSFMADYNLQNPPPSYLMLCENGTQYYNAAGQVLPQYVPTVNFLQQWFGRSFNPKGTYDWNGNGKAEAYALEGEQCLVFYLGGIPTYTANGTIGMTGFNPNVANPALAAAAGTTRKGPYFNFSPSRLTMLVHFPVYIDGWKFQAAPKPYAFFSSQGKINGYSLTDCATIGAQPYYEMTAGGSANFAYNNRYQIISAGADGTFGNAVNKTLPWNPAAGAIGAGRDDQANFGTSFLAGGQK